MCSIGGCTGDQATSEQMRRMSRLTRHRGPDDYGDFVDKGIGLFNNRLSIIDLSGGHQPLLNEDETILTVCNGEIYNFRELRNTLEEKHHFRTRTDVEVIVHGYEEFGTSIFEKLNGMFAIALWDRTHRKLLLARDRVGIKPLYYAPLGKDLVFCSEIKGIMSHPEIVPKVNKCGLYSLISLNYLPFEQTMFKGIFKIPPGYYHDSEKGLIQYWAPPPVDRFYAPEADSVRAAVEESVRRQLVSDVEIGSFLSGGLDTSTIVAFASKYYNGRLKTFCMGFGHEYDEIEDAKMVADHFGTEHHSLVINDKDTLKLYPRMIWHSEQPKLNTYGWFVNEYASKYVKVCLSGLGGDELFFGYPTSTRFMNFQKAQRLMKFPGVSIFGAFMGGKRGQTLSGIRKRAQTYLSIISPIYGSEDHRFFSLPEKDVLGCHESLTKRVEDQFFKSRLEFVQQAVNAEFFTKMPDDYLTIDDSMSMAHSLENRVPLLDNQLLDLMLPVGYRRNYLGGVGKALLRQAMGPILPQKCLEKPKQGFSPDILHWWKGEMGDEVRRKLPDSPAVKQYFAMEKITEMMSHADNSYSKASLAFHIYAFHIWHDLFIDRGKENADVLVLPLH